MTEQPYDSSSPRGGWWTSWAQRADDASLRLWGLVVRRDLEVIDRRAFTEGMSGWWLCITAVLGGLFASTHPGRWLTTVGLSVIVAFPAGLCVLRGVHDGVGRGRRYTRGGWRAAACYVVAFAGALAALQPVTG
jgi:hypothetical protein